MASRGRIGRGGRVSCFTVVRDAWRGCLARELVVRAERVTVKLRRITRGMRLVRRARAYCGLWAVSSGVRRGPFGLSLGPGIRSELSVYSRHLSAMRLGVLSVLRLRCDDMLCSSCPGCGLGGAGGLTSPGSSGARFAGDVGVRWQAVGGALSPAMLRRPSCFWC